jgi:uncharacterized protein YukE
MSEFSVISLSDIRTNGGTQSRSAISREVVAEYAAAVSEGAAFPPVTLFYDGDAYWLADGFHRFEAYREAGLAEIPAEVRQGGQRDAILYSVGANASHGLRRTNDDKRRAVLTLLNDPEWSKWSDREIARKCGVDHKTVAGLRPKLTGEFPSERTYTTKHGTQATMQTAEIGRPQVEAEPKVGGGSPEVQPASNAVEKRDIQAAEPAPDEEAPAEPDAGAAKARRMLARLTHEALIDEVMGLVADLSDAKRDLEKVTAERDALKAKLKEATQGDLGRALGAAQRRADAATGRMNEYMATIKRLEYRLKKAEARVRELEDAPIAMDAA